MKLITDFFDAPELYMCNIDLHRKLAQATWRSNNDVWGEHLLVGLKGEVIATATDPIINNKIKDAFLN